MRAKPRIRKYPVLFTFLIILAFAGGIAIGKLVFSTHTTKTIETEKALSALPKPETTSGERGELGIDKNINESTIDNYLNRPDSVYYDVRMLEDPADYAAIGGDSHLSGIVNGFEVVPYPYLVNVQNLPESVGKTYDGPTLYTEKDGSYTPNFKESEQILSDLFPKDKNIFLMCGGGGYSGMLKNMLINLGWDANKIYVVGGYWFYDGKNRIEIRNPDNTYSFWKVPYHEINFENLTKLN